MIFENFRPLIFEKDVVVPIPQPKRYRVLMIKNTNIKKATVEFINSTSEMLELIDKYLDKFDVFDVRVGETFEEYFRKTERSI